MTGNATFNLAEAVDASDFVDTGESRAIDTAEDSTVTTLFNVALDVDALESVQGSANRTCNRILGAESGALANDSSRRDRTVGNTFELTSPLARLACLASWARSESDATAHWERRRLAGVLVVGTLLASQSRATGPKDESTANRGSVGLGVRVGCDQSCERDCEDGSKERTHDRGSRGEPEEMLRG